MSDIKIRTATPKDAKRLLEIYSPYVQNTSISFEYDPPTLKEFKGRIKNTLKKYPYIVAEIDGKIVGYSYAGVFHARRAYNISCELSIYVDMNCHKQGIGSALYSELEKRLLAQNIHTLYACIAATPRPDDKYLTDGSIQFHGKMGYKIVGTFTDCAIKYNQNYNMVYMEKHI